MESLELRDYLRICWKRRWLILLAVAVAAGAASGLSNQRTPEYLATAKVFIGPRSAAQGNLSAALEELNFSREFVASYAELLRSRPLAEQVVGREGLQTPPKELVKRIKTRIIPETRIIEVSVRDTGATRAQRIANTLVETFVAQVQQEFGGGAGVRASVFEPALRPAAPVSPKPVRDGILGGVLGLMVGVGVAFLLEQLDTTLGSREDVERSLAPLPLLAAIPTVPGNGAVREAFIERQPKSPAAEAFRILRTNVRFLGVDRPLRTLLVTSPYAEDGKTTVAVNLAASMAAAGLRTLLLETDLRRPVLHDSFDLPQTPGLTDVLVGAAELAQVVRPTRVARLSVLPSGRLPANPSELLGSRRMVELLREAEGMADVLILDSPPGLPVADASVLAPHTDGVILVVRSGRTHRERARDTVAGFERLGARVLGAVLNDASTTGAYYYYYRYYHEASEDGERRDQARGPGFEVPIEPAEGARRAEPAAGARRAEPAGEGPESTGDGAAPAGEPASTSEGGPQYL